MPVERQVISVRYVRKFGNDVPKYIYDYSGFEVGDWFIASNAARVRSARTSVRTHVEARMWNFEAEPIAKGGMKFTRTA